jgi:hypothetical protein
LTTVVLARQYSRISGAISLDSDTVDLAGLLLVDSVAIRVQETDRDGVDPSALEALDCASNAVQVERDEHVALIVQPFDDLQAVAAEDQRRRLVGLQVVQLVSDLALNLEHIAKAGRDQQSGARTTPLDHRVGRGGHGVHDVADLAGVQLELVRQPLGDLQERPRRVVWSGEDLVD